MYDATEWSTRWVWPFELYAPVFEAARDNGSPLVALNPATEAMALRVTFVAQYLFCTSIYKSCLLLLVSIPFLPMVKFFWEQQPIFFEPQKWSLPEVRRKLPLEGLQALTPEDRGKYLPDALGFANTLRDPNFRSYAATGRDQQFFGEPMVRGWCLLV